MGQKSMGILRIYFPKHSGNASDLQETDWDTFFKTFDEHELDFLYQKKKLTAKKVPFINL